MHAVAAELDQPVGLLGQANDQRFLQLQELARKSSARDERDTNREIAPLRQAEDADLLDTSELGIDEAIAEAVRLVEARLSARA